VDWYQTVFDVIDLRSFSNLWYWIALAVLWSSASHWVLGVPWDMITRARRHGGQAEADMMVLVGINVRRIMYVAQNAGLWLVGFVAFVLTALGLMAFWYWVEFAQAVFLFAAPMAVVGAASVRVARQIEEAGPDAEALFHRLFWHRVTIQGVGIVAIFVTAMWGMWQNLNAAIL
jgi:hypothetical protein